MYWGFVILLMLGAATVAFVCGVEWQRVRGQPGRVILTVLHRTPEEARAMQKKAERAKRN